MLSTRPGEWLLRAMVAHAPERVMGGHPGVRDLSHEELEARVREVISAPRPLVHGGGDTDVPPEHRHRGVAAIPGATFEVLDGGTHLAVHAHPDAERAQGRAPDLLRAAPRGG